MRDPTAAKPLAWSAVRDSMVPIVPMLREAYDKSGRKPDMAAFEATGTKDLRGPPAWDMQRWKDHA
ncbi:MAG: hypothetical protein ABI190_10565 [Casimicrobiaceae bacterium]